MVIIVVTVAMCCLMWHTQTKLNYKANQSKIRSSIFCLLQMFMMHIIVSIMSIIKGTINLSDS